MFDLDLKPTTNELLWRNLWIILDFFVRSFVKSAKSIC